MIKRVRPHWADVFALAFLAMLAACSGGSQSGSPAQPPVTSNLSKPPVHRASTTGGPYVSIAVLPAKSTTGPYQPDFSNLPTPAPTYQSVIGTLVTVSAWNFDGTPGTDCTFNGLPSTVVSDYVVSNSAGVVTPASMYSPGNWTSVFFTAPATGTVAATCNFEGTVSTAEGIGYQITAPTLIAAATYGSTAVDTNYQAWPGSYALHWGLMAQGQGSVNWTYSVGNAAAGQIALFQLVNENVSATSTSGVQTTLQNTGGTYESDNGEPYSPAVSSNSTWQAYDAPAFLLTGDQTLTLKQNFSDYFMYQPSSPDPLLYPTIWVALGELNWGWSGDANYVSTTVCTQEDGEAPTAVRPALRSTPTPHCSTKTYWENNTSVTTQAVPIVSYALPTWGGMLVNALHKRIVSPVLK